MIAYVQGTVARLEPALAIIDCQGIGYAVKISLTTYHAIQGKEQVRLWTFFQVREDAQTLYGFSNEAELRLFEWLISISGVGGNTALTILSSLTPGELLDAIRNEQTHVLKSVKGIGAKTAGRIVLELKDKITLEATGTSAGSLSQPGTVQNRKQDALQALAQLGMPKAVMAKRVDQILKENGEEISLEEIIKLALKN